jgi:hypothetical protein
MAVQAFSKESYPLEDKMHPRKNARAAATVAAAMLMVCGSALAEEKPEDCQVEPGTKAQDRVPSETDETVTLSDCNGILKPAPVGDRELVEPAPEAGETPIISPEEIPDQQPAD